MTTTTPTTTDRQDLVTALVDAGCDPAEVERQVRESAPWLDGESRDALWLYAWSYRGLRQKAGAAVPGTQRLTLRN